VGIGLADTLDSLISSNEITPQLAVRIMERVGIHNSKESIYLTNSLSQYDKAVCDVLSKQVKAKASFKGHLHTYRNCDDVWTFYAR
jgi:transcription initiation factor TFIIA small subunit